MGYGGARPGSGRKKGTKNPETLEREKVFAALRERILRDADRLYQAQRSLGLGIQFLYKIVEVQKGKTTIQEHVLVEDPEEIKRILDEEDPDTYYYITTKEPNNIAIDSLFNRALGKPKESVDVTVKKKIILDDDD